MSKNSESVKKWRKVSKLRIIDAMGGKCCGCGYNRCPAALALHHLDPSKKDIGLGGIRANPVAWEKIVIELRKCVLVCHVCHAEIHDGIRDVPKNAPKFDEAYATYQEVERQLRVQEALAARTPCVVCGKLKPAFQLTCSLECSGKRRSIVNWGEIDISKLIETHGSVLAVAEVLGISDAAVHKRMRKLGLK